MDKSEFIIKGCVACKLVCDIIQNVIFQGVNL